MGVFKLSNGEEFVMEGNEGKRLRILASRKYINQKKRKDVEMPENLINSSDERITKQVTLRDRETFEKIEAVDTYLLAENKDFKEYPSVEFYNGEFAINVEVRHKAEVILKADDWTKHLYFDWKGKMNFFDFFKNVPERIMEGAMDGKLKSQGVKFLGEEDCYEESVEILMHKENGEYITIEMTEREVESSVVSVKLVEFEEKMIV